MTLIAQFITFDCREPSRLGQFWNEAIGVPVQGVNGQLRIAVPMTPALAMVLSENFPVREPVASRSHISFTPLEGTLSDEVDRLIAAGATLLDDHRRPEMDNVGWVVMADPEGNEFQVESNDAESNALESRIQAENARHQAQKATDAAETAAVIAQRG
ncbi:hypothetical protein KGQ19_45265 [Catenulispora sp. NL8]|uniref:Glyoxalase-like domain-containing protein n=1 Tax=Catenulispora pinistramenti TaxID=2705254 RepID=A0ABS5L788_9ACTN|nr:VOC family protein [Catenulispora pinistramenti]MBS2554087.1 hypothetical protein [Catenulispora pinistramenti]